MSAVSGVPPKSPGSYALLMCVCAPLSLRVGALGACAFAPGWYLYLGSALGGLAGRLGRHLRAEKRLHWHIDYLLTRAELAGAWFGLGSERNECRWAQALAASGVAEPWQPGFGASDCRCTTHLYRFAVRPSRARVAALWGVGHSLRALPLLGGRVRGEERVSQR